MLLATVMDVLSRKSKSVEIDKFNVTIVLILVPIQNVNRNNFKTSFQLKSFPKIGVHRFNKNYWRDRNSCSSLQRLKCQTSFLVPSFKNIEILHKIIRSVYKT